MDPRFNHLGAVLAQVERFGTGDHPLADGRLNVALGGALTPRVPVRKGRRKMPRTEAPAVETARPPPKRPAPAAAAASASAGGVKRKSKLPPMA